MRAAARAQVRFMNTGKAHEVEEIGVLAPDQQPVECLEAGEVRPRLPVWRTRSVASWWLRGFVASCSGASPADSAALTT